MPDQSVIRLGCLRIADHFIAAVTNGRLKNADIGFSSFEMQLACMNSFEHIKDSLIDGQIDGAFIPLPFAMDIFRAGLEIKLLMFANRAGGIFVKNTAADINRIKDLKNKTILVPCLMTVQNMLLHKMLLSAGLQLGTLRDKKANVFLEVIPENIIAEIVENDSDNDIGGFVASEPFATIALKAANCKKMCKFDSLWADHPDSVFVLKNSFIEKTPEHVGELVKAFITSAEVINSSSSNSVLSYAETFFKQNIEIVKSLLPGIKGMFVTAKLFPAISDVETVQDYIAAQDFLIFKKIDIQKFIDASFLQYSKED